MHNSCKKATIFIQPSAPILAAALSTDTITMMPLSGSFPKPILDLSDRKAGNGKNGDQTQPHGNTPVAKIYMGRAILPTPQRLKKSTTPICKG